MKLSILIPTHNRPKLFTHCIKTALLAIKSTDYQCEIIVNNDSSDIDHVYDSVVPIQYLEYKSPKLTDIYEKLYNVATGEYVCYLEDDDYYMRHMLKDINFNHDMYMTEYVSEPLMRELGMVGAMNRLFVNRKIKCDTPAKYLSQFDNRDFQLGQVIFKRTAVSFPENDHINNDIILIRRVAEHLKTIKYLKGFRWVQTTNGNDNISFPELNIDERF